MRNVANTLRGLTVVSTTALLVLVMAVGAVGAYAQAMSTWTWFFYMERTIEAATDIALALLFVSLLAFFGFVLVATVE